MKVRALHVAIVFGTLALAGTPALGAAIEANVPFAFHVGETLLPAAEYIVETAGGNEPSALVIRSKGTGKRTLIDTNQIPDKDDPQTLGLVFHQVGDKVYLSEVWGVTDSGRGVKHLVDGEPFEPANEGSKRRIATVRVVDGRDG